jgi:hypothetical protein
MKMEYINIHCTSRSQKCGEERSRKDLKHEDLKIEIDCMWKFETKLIPLKTGAD